MLTEDCEPGIYSMVKTRDCSISVVNLGIDGHAAALGAEMDRAGCIFMDKE